jgi:hypothetical protein
MNQQTELGILGPPSDMTGKPRVWTWDELEPLSLAAWPDSKPTRASVYDAMMVIEGFPAPYVTEPQRERIRAAYAARGAA